MGLPRRKRWRLGSVGETLRPLLWEARPRGESPGRGAGGKSLSPRGAPPTRKNGARARLYWGSSHKKAVRGPGSVGAVTEKRCEGSGLLGKRCARFCGRPALGANCLDGEPAESPLRREARLPQEKGARLESVGLSQESGARDRVYWGNAAPAFVGGPPSGRIAWPRGRRKVPSPRGAPPTKKSGEARLCWSAHKKAVRGPGSVGATLRPLLWEARPRGELPGRGPGGKSPSPRGAPPTRKNGARLGSVGAPTKKVRGAPRTTSEPSGSAELTVSGSPLRPP